MVGVCSIVVQGALVRPAVARMGERRVLVMGLSGAVLGYLAYALAPTGGWMLAVMPISAFMFFTGPALQGLMSRRVAPNEFGLLQGTNSSLMGLAGIVGPSLFTRVFAACLVPRLGLSLPGAPFVIASVLLALATVLALRATRTTPVATATEAQGAASP